MCICDRFWENRPKRGKQFFSVSPVKALWVDFFEKFFMAEMDRHQLALGLGGIAVFSRGTIKEIIPSNAGNTAINCACATHRVPAVFYRFFFFLVTASGQQLTEKCGTKSAV